MADLRKRFGELLAAHRRRRGLCGDDFVQTALKDWGLMGWILSWMGDVRPFKAHDCLFVLIFRIAYLIQVSCEINFSFIETALPHPVNFGTVAKSLGIKGYKHVEMARERRDLPSRGQINLGVPRPATPTRRAR
jgi:hypothetical protein